MNAAGISFRHNEGSMAIAKVRPAVLTQAQLVGGVTGRKGVRKIGAAYARAGRRAGRSGSRSAQILRAAHAAALDEPGGDVGDGGMNYHTGRIPVNPCFSMCVIVSY